ncbi:cupin domain-containing protein [Streptomyces broussonetiae]|uniref:cupin domain-containing protein n=1 Tax=Streptomyces broussonetiae TaxID=2686304 RepID=UPI0035DC93F4
MRDWVRQPLARVTEVSSGGTGSYERPPCMDLLSDHLVRARATGAVFARTVAEPPWGLRLGGSTQLSVHTVVRGRGYLWLDAPGSAVELIPGSVTLVRGGPNHYIGHEPGAECLEPEEFRARHAHAVPADNPQATVFLCGAYQFSGDVGSGLLDALPQVMTLSAADDDPLRDVITLLSRELVRTELPSRSSWTASWTCFSCWPSAATSATARPHRAGTGQPRTRGWAPRCKPCTRTRPTRGRSPNSPRSAVCPGPPSRGCSGRNSARPPCST